MTGADRPTSDIGTDTDTDAGTGPDRAGTPVDDAATRPIAALTRRVTGWAVGFLDLGSTRARHNAAAAAAAITADRGEQDLAAQRPVRP